MRQRHVDTRARMLNSQIISKKSRPHHVHNSPRHFVLIRGILVLWCWTGRVNGCSKTCAKRGIISDDGHQRNIVTNCGWSFWSWATKIKLTGRSRYQCRDGYQNWRRHCVCFRSPNRRGRFVIDADQSDVEW
jgi:hypothetical protein